jgi:HSP20 family protein
MIYRRIFGSPGWDFRSPFGELERMRRQMDRLFEGLSGPGQQRVTAGVFPLANLTETKDNFLVRAELPGLSSNELDIQATANSVLISGERKIPAEKEARYHRREREAGRFSRVVSLPHEINPDRVEAGLVNGILTVKLPKTEIAKPRQISVK